MIIVLNLIVSFFVVGTLVAAYKWKSWKVLVASLVAVLIYVQIQPSYMPKGEVLRTDLPLFEYSSKKIEDRNLSPKPPSYYDKKAKDDVSEGLQFKENP